MIIVDPTTNRPAFDPVTSPAKARSDWPVNNSFIHLKRKTFTTDGYAFWVTFENQGLEQMTRITPPTTYPTPAS